MDLDVDSQCFSPFFKARNFKGWWTRHNYVAFSSPCNNPRSKDITGPSWRDLWIVTSTVHWLHAPQLLELRLRGALFFEMLKEIAMTKGYLLHTYDDISGPPMLMKMADEAQEFINLNYSASFGINCAS
nr:hypothetical protein CFP56_29181 [Quercus suber]